MEKKNANTSDRELRINRTLNAPVELVWEVWTNPEHLAKWWGPDGFTNTISSLDVTPGGAFDLTMHGPDGTDYKNQSIFTEVIPLKKIVYEHLTGPKFTATVTFEAIGDKTRLTWHMLFETAEEFIQTVRIFKADQGMKQNVEKLEHYLSTKKVITGYAPINGLNMYYEIHGASAAAL